VEARSSSVSRSRGWQEQPTNSAITVLVADDEPDVRLLVRVVLERAGLHVVAEAVDGHDALATVNRLAPPTPTVMVLDYKMPGLSGLEVAARVLAESPEQPIILFSANLSADVRERAHELGVRSCVPKAEVQTLPALITALATE
jgi:CheY-like chemotaxis protein